MTAVMHLLTSEKPLGITAPLKARESNLYTEKDLTE